MLFLINTSKVHVLRLCWYTKNDDVDLCFSCCAEPYPDVTYTIQMRRKPLFYVFNMILPCFIITFVALLGKHILTMLLNWKQHEMCVVNVPWVRWFSCRFLHAEWLWREGNNGHHNPALNDCLPDVGSRQYATDLRRAPTHRYAAMVLMSDDLSLTITHVRH